LAEVNTIQEIEKVNPEVQEIIDNYTSNMPEQPFYQESLVFQIEGNFTGSGNREIIGFYGDYSFGVYIGGIEAAFCFVLDSNGDKVENVYHINYLTASFGKETEAKSGLINAGALGKPIVWGGRIMGYVGDFDEDGTDKLYLYRLTGMDRRPIFFRFIETGFVETMEFPEVGLDIFITGVNPDEKTMDIQLHHSIEDPEDPRVIFETRTYKWDNTTQRYEIINTSDETKRYRWNSDTKRYDEI
jgi:hypothetical protein